MKAKIKSFRKFINDCYVEHNAGNTYYVLDSTDEDIFVKVCADENNGWSILKNEFLKIDNDAKRELIYLKVDEFIADSKEEINDAEHPGEAGGIYSNLY